MEITGRLTANAKVNETKKGNKVVGFTLAINDSYRKDGEQKKITTYVDCSYWINEGIAVYLTKGSLVQLYGRMSAHAWVNKGGEAKASLSFHTNNIKFLGKSGNNGTERANTDAQVEAPLYNDTAKDDLPF